MFQGDDTDADQTLKRIIRSDSTDGVIAFQGAAPQISAELESHDTPLVVINPGIRVTSDCAVILDFEELSYRATAYLVECGHREIGMIGMQCMPLFFEQTKRGFTDALKDAGIEAKPDWIRGEAQSEATAVDAMNNMLAAGKPTAVFCAQDNFAISAMSACRAAGLRVPEDISFIGIDDIPEARYIDPPLTTIPISPAKIAEAALALISQKLKSGSAESVVLPLQKIVKRGSVRAILPKRP